MAKITWSTNYIISAVSLFLIFSTWTFLRTNRTTTIAPVDPAVVQEIRETFDPPSDLPYNLTEPDREDFSQLGQSKLYIEMFKFKRGGTFLEAGAWDGEGISNSLMLERKYGWTGLLIEPDPTNYDKMMQKHRKATHLRGCIGTDPSQTQSLTFRTYKGEASWYSRVVGHGLKHQAPSEESTDVTVKCFPLAAILKAANIRQLDLLMLDLEGLEINVIKSFDWAAFDIPVVVLECFSCLDIDGNFITKEPKLIAKRNFQKQFMESLGYSEKFYAPSLDIIYVRDDVALDGDLLDLDVPKLKKLIS